jgi:hypothetical protein
MKRSARKLLQHIGRRGADTNAEPAGRGSPGSVSQLPVAGYESLPVAVVLAHLGDLTPRDLAALGHHERTHQSRLVVLADIDARLGNEPWPGYDELDVDGVRFGMDGASSERLVMVLAYERAHKNRAGVVLAAQQKPA